uniref:Integrin beta n=1 Tax=Littorina littorea TaxID=31216 RepID=A0A2P1L4C7_LITLI|nr:integrin beta 2 [Littorina littorea]
MTKLTVMTSRRWETQGGRFLTLGLFLVLFIARSEACSGTTCAQCIVSGGECAWCADANFTALAGERCSLAANLQEQGCVDIQSPQTAEVSRQDKAVDDGNVTLGIEPTQLQPQAMRIKLRPRGKGHDFHVTFRPANNFPVDLYFLFDLSWTMKAYIDDLQRLARRIADEIGKISTNYKLGYGTFQDKVLLPFTNTHPAKLQNQCQDCAPPFDYHHELSLTSSLINFTAAVDNSQFTGNIDSPEGGFDAMMQAIVCKSVGWRDNSRQLIIFASDARMHFAGDGKLAGVITPNDGECHLQGRVNPMAFKQDYPSVGQLAAALDKSKKHVIFAVQEAVLTEYQQLHTRVPRSSVNVLKAGKDSNVVDIVRDKYREMTAGVQLEYKTSSDNIRVSITPTCESRESREGRESTRCTNLEIGKKVEPFVVNIRADRCPENPKERVQTVTIAPSDFLKDSLNVTVEIICDCDCQIPPDVTPDPSEDCSQGNGTKECGICRCYPGRSGSSCECGQEDLDTAVSEPTCRNDAMNSTAAPECNGVGECVCGVCQCQPNFSGRFCQCNVKVCPVFDGLLCGGNGECRCEECQCNANFTGLACECPGASDTCLPTSAAGETEGEVCSGHGECRCGSCVCEEGYVGRHCQTCFLCGNSLCEVDNYRECAKCAVIPKHRGQCPADCPEVVIVPEVDTEDEQTEDCKDWLTEECHVRFSVQNPGANTTLYVQETKVCTEGPNILIIVLGVVGGVVGVGLILLLLVKLLTSLFDRLEYQHFLRELQSPKWAKFNNPIYKEATTTYHNPVMTKD